jgi:hypothetical protein
LLFNLKRGLLGKRASGLQGVIPTVRTELPFSLSQLPSLSSNFYLLVNPHGDHYSHHH